MPEYRRVNMMNMRRHTNSQLADPNNCIAPPTTPSYITRFAGVTDVCQSHYSDGLPIREKPSITLPCNVVQNQFVSLLKRRQLSTYFH